MIVKTDMSHDVRVWKEARTLAAVGHEVLVLASWNPTLPAEERQPGIRVARVAPGQASAIERETQPNARRTTGEPPRKLPFAWLRNKIWNSRADLEHLKWIRSWQPEAIHIHDSDRLFVGILCRSAHRVPLVYDAHEYLRGLVVDNSLAWKFTRAFHLTLERYLCPRADAVITVNQDIAERLKERYHLPEVVVLHNYPLYQPSVGRTGALRSFLPIDQRSRFLLLLQGRLTAFRGFEQFIDTVAELPNVTGVILGSGPEEARLKSMARSLNLGDRLTFVPQVPWEQLHQFTADADLGFSITQNVGENSVLALPNKLFEYLMAGVPVVASDFPLLRRYVADEGVGIVVPPSDPSQIAAAIRPLLEDPARLDAMKTRALEIGASRYSWEAQAKVLVDLYARLDRMTSKHRVAEPRGTQN